MGVFTEGLLRAAERTMREFGAEHADDVRESISESCPQYHNGRGGHSPDGAPPYLESGRLFRTVRTATIVQGLRVITIVAAGAGLIYGRILESGDHPFMLPAFRRWSPEFRQRLIASIPKGVGGTFR